MIKQKESHLVRQINDYCKYRNLLFIRINSGAIRTEKGGLVKLATAGTSDFIGLYKGKFIALEAKVGKNKQQPSQIEFEKQVKKNGGEYWLVYSLEDFIEKLLEFKHSLETFIGE